MPRKGFGAIVAIGVAAAAAPASADATCRVEGVWEQVSLIWDGRVMPPHARPLRKIAYRGHWMEIGTEPGRDKLPRQTELDNLRAMQTFGGAGTYSTTDHTFTQHIDSFTFPDAEGATLTGPCRTYGKFWRYSFSTAGIPEMAKAAKQVTELFRRIR